MKNQPVKSKHDLLELLYENATAIKKFGVAEFGFFGSFVRNDVTENSDVDFLVDFLPDQKSYKNFIQLAYFLEDLCGRKIELVTKKRS